MAKLQIMRITIPAMKNDVELLRSQTDKSCIVLMLWQEGVLTMQEVASQNDSDMQTTQPAAIDQCSALHNCTYTYIYHRFTQITTTLSAYFYKKTYSLHIAWLQLLPIVAPFLSITNLSFRFQGLKLNSYLKEQLRQWCSCTVCSSIPSFVQSCIAATT